jgi:hypothetical protein
MAYNTFGAFRPSGRGDRGTRRGAKRCIVTADLQILDHEIAKLAGIKGAFFQSGSEAKRWVALNMLLRAGHVRNLRRQVKFPLHVVRPDGLKETIGSWTADHVYEERQAVGPDEFKPWKGEADAAPQPPSREVWRWIEVVEDVKPSGGHREDLYLWKRLHFECEYGRKIIEWTGR